ncbi:MAG TPA: hypothetical protein VH678_04555 [Xanthobacteraceae bacterium]
MSSLEAVERPIGRHAQASVQQRTAASQDEACSDPAGNRTLYVLGLGIVGAILTNGLVFIYFASFYASG